MAPPEPLSPEFLQNVSTGPGVYLMLGKKEVFYVGKAVNLRKRLASYKRKNSQPSKTAVMLSRVERIETILTTTEKEALILEASLIKKHRPRYNVILRDDKNYPLIKVTVRDRWPRIVVTRRRLRDGSRYFGPYSSSSSMRETLKLLQTLFPLRRCPRVKPRSRPCLNFQLGHCPAPCCNAVDEGRYRELVNGVLMVLEGRNRELSGKLQEKMTTAARELRFEEAALIRDQITGLEQTLERQIIVSEHGRDQDIFGLARKDASVGIAILFVRAGIISGVQSFFLPDPLGSDEDILAESIIQYYNPDRQPPPDLLLPLHPVDEELLLERLAELRERPVKILVPQKGRYMQLMRMAQQNAVEIFAEQDKKKKSWRNLAAALRKALVLDNQPDRIECIDISNISGTLAVGSLVSFHKGVKYAKGYRHYRIRTGNDPDDYAMMREVLERRIARGIEDADLPDLMLLDGGKGHLNLALDVLNKHDPAKKIDLVAIAKEKQKEGEKLYRPGRKNPAALPRHSPALLFLMRVRDEAHRFGITHHRKLRKKHTLQSELDTLRGVGSVRKKMLLTTFGSIGELKKASAGQIQDIPGIGPQLARSIYNQLHSNET
ncbi:MAG: excinuclease ABC subunit UvrC [Desulfobulbaceae bacterium]|nr:excinuclease ABC subunit UvrC [Desulfobulbaceae bacterium]